MKKIIFISMMVILMIFNIAHADLNLIGQGTSIHGTYNLIYDTDLNVTWYDFTNDRDTWQNQLDWADALSVTFGSNVYTDWRLPFTVDGPYVWGYDGTTTAGYNITSSEMGHLYNTELGNLESADTSGNPRSVWGLIYTGDFQNLQASHYWSGTEYTGWAYPSAWLFPMGGSGGQGTDPQYSDLYAIAVMDGRAIVPEPMSSILFIAGGSLFAGLRHIKRKNL